MAFLEREPKRSHHAKPPVSAPSVMHDDPRVLQAAASSATARTPAKKAQGRSHALPSVAVLALADMDCEGHILWQAGGAGAGAQNVNLSKMLKWG